MYEECPVNVSKRLCNFQHINRDVESTNTIRHTHSSNGQRASVRVERVGCERDVLNVREGPLRAACILASEVGTKMRCGAPLGRWAACPSAWEARRARRVTAVGRM